MFPWEDVTVIHSVEVLVIAVLMFLLEISDVVSSVILVSQCIG